MAAPVLRIARCRHCGAESRGEQPKYCWLCRARLEPVAQSVMVWPWRRQQTERTFSLSTLMIIVAGCAVLVGVFRESPGLGILLAIAGTPALIKTHVSASERKASGRPMTGWQKLATFAATFAVVVGAVAGTLVLIVVAFRIALNNCMNQGHC